MAWVAGKTRSSKNLLNKYNGLLKSLEIEGVYFDLNSSGKNLVMHYTPEAFESGKAEIILDILANKEKFEKPNIDSIHSINSALILSDFSKLSQEFTRIKNAMEIASQIGMFRDDISAKELEDEIDKDLPKSNIDFYDLDTQIKMIEKENEKDAAKTSDKTYSLKAKIKLLNKFDFLITTNNSQDIIRIETSGANFLSENSFKKVFETLKRFDESIKKVSPHALTISESSIEKINDTEFETFLDNLKIIDFHDKKEFHMSDSINSKIAKQDVKEWGEKTFVSRMKGDKIHTLRPDSETHKALTVACCSLEGTNKIKAFELVDALEKGKLSKAGAEKGMSSIGLPTFLIKTTLEDLSFSSKNMHQR